MQSLLPLPKLGNKLLDAMRVERDLADRHGECFSLLTLDLDKASSSSTRRLEQYLGHRLRFTDVAERRGSATRLLLRRTDRAGAALLQADLENWANERGLNLGTELQVYDGAADEDAAIQANLDLLMVQPLGRGKRFMDIAVAGTLLALLAPLLGLIALAIRLESAGPVLFSQTRIGAGGRGFRFLKFRSMVANAEELREGLDSESEQDGPIFKIRQDPRITRVGKILRRTSLDEAPQLFNVLKGDMTLVGPRPQLPAEVGGYKPWQRRRLEVPSGLTCIWQVSGRSELSFEEWMRLDCRYAKQQSPLLDASLLAKTIPAVLSKKGAY